MPDLTPYRLAATPKSVHWGYFDHSLAPVLTVGSGAVVEIETLTHRAGDAPDVMMDDGTRSVYEGVDDRGPGGHIMTGPIAVEGAMPGDTLQVDILDVRARVPYGSNFTSRAGLLYDDFGQRLRATIYRLSGEATLAEAVFAFDFPSPPTRPGAILLPGAAERAPALKGIRVPLRPHLGIAAVAPAEAGRFSSVPPAQWGGNIDNWRFGVGSRMYYPVFVPGALFSAGDPHASQGDGEISGTAIEASMNVTLRFTIRRDFPVHNPVLETFTHWTTHAFHAELGSAMRLAALEMLDFLVTHKGLSRDDAYSLMSVAADFGVTQVVDQRQGIHASIAKAVFP